MNNLLYLLYQIFYNKFIKLNTYEYITVFNVYFIVKNFYINIKLITYSIFKQYSNIIEWLILYKE